MKNAQKELNNSEYFTPTLRMDNEDEDEDENEKTERDIFKVALGYVRS